MTTPSVSTEMTAADLPDKNKKRSVASLMVKMMQTRKSMKKVKK